MDTYTLELLNINEKEDLFFTPSEEDKLYADEFNNYSNQLINKYIQIGDLSDQMIRVHKKHKTQSGEFLSVSQITGFITAEAAESFFLETTKNADHFKIRQLRQQWHIANNIIAQHTILDWKGNIVKKLHVCGETCFRYGDCPPVETFRGCGIYPTKNLGSLYHIPIVIKI